MLRYFDFKGADGAVAPEKDPNHIKGAHEAEVREVGEVTGTVDEPAGGVDGLVVAEIVHTCLEVKTSLPKTENV